MVEGAPLLREYGRNLIEGSNPSLSAKEDAPVAQLDRVSGYEPGGRRFESFRARHFLTKNAFYKQFCSILVIYIARRAKMSLSHSSEPIQFNLVLPDKPKNIENYPNLSQLCHDITKNMDAFKHALLRFQENLEPHSKTEIIHNLTEIMHKTLDLSLILQQHFGLLSDSDEEIHLEEPVINYVRAVINNVTRMDNMVLSAQEALYPSRPHNR